MAGWHHRLDRCESEWTPVVGDGQGGLACCNSWGHRELDTTEWLNWSDKLGRQPLKIVLSNWAEVVREEPRYIGVFAGGKRKFEHQKISANHKSQTFQVNDFRVFLYMGRCKCLGSLKLLLYPVFPSGYIPGSSSRVWWFGGRQHSLLTEMIVNVFLFTQIKCKISEARVRAHCVVCVSSPLCLQFYSFLKVSIQQNT